MLLLYPSFYPDFHCLAGACPDSCCVGCEGVKEELRVPLSSHPFSPSSKTIDLRRISPFP